PERSGALVRSGADSGACLDTLSTEGENQASVDSRARRSSSRWTIDRGIHGRDNHTEPRRKVARLGATSAQPLPHHAGVHFPSGLSRPRARFPRSAAAPGCTSRRPVRGPGAWTPGGDVTYGRSSMSISRGPVRRVPRTRKARVQNPRLRDTTMRFMMLVIPKAYENARADFVPPADLVAKMTKYNESLTKAS